ncbi:MAG: hypothetical protein ACI8QS_001866 [Planctomycetota bacterium]|jgi:hypothetical protein
MMHTPIITWLACSLGGSLGGDPGLESMAPSAIATPVTQEQEEPQEEAPVDPVAELDSIYKESLIVWRDALRAAESTADKKELRANHPVDEFYPQFAALLENGHHAAAVWMITNVRHTDRKRSEATKVAKGLYARLFGGDLPDHDTLLAASERLIRDRKSLGPELSTQYLTSAFERAEAPETKAMLGLMTGNLYGRLGGEENDKLSFTWLDRVATEFAETEAGVTATDLVFVSKYLSLGSTAPEFGGESIDGTEIKLSDYRGKIVVVDFFGFW